jgi:Family of unknown function (DUF5709)
MSDSDDMYDGAFQGSDQVDPSESLTGDNTDDPLDVGYSPPDREPTATRYGTTADEQRAGDSLDQRLAQEVPDVSETDVDAAAADPRSGRLVAPDEGAHAVEEAEMIATDVGRAGYAASAEEAAVHIVDEP